MKERIDVVLVQKGLAASREKAKALIMAGAVYCGEQRIEKAGVVVDCDSDITVRGARDKYVSRGGKKLEKALDVFGIDVTGAVCADIGASTGGFTDCMLQHGAKQVFAVDVGYGQLAWELRTDPRVVNIERTNIRYITEKQFTHPLDFFSVDVSFISLKLVLPAVVPFLSDGASGVCLIKPQFEAGKALVGKHGVVRDAATHREVIGQVAGYAVFSGLVPAGLDFSPIKGPKGNIEYLLYVKQRAGITAQLDVKAVVDAAHIQLKEDS